MFVHLFNAEGRMSLSSSGGAGTGGTIEYGITLAHDDNQPWYKGWSGAFFRTIGIGAYANTEVSTELNYGWSNNSSVKGLEGTGVVVGASYGAILDMGYEMTVSNTALPLHNVSLGVSSPSVVPFETHAYKTETIFLGSFGVK
jgi:hypothetical protein